MSRFVNTKPMKTNSCLPRVKVAFTTTLEGVLSSAFVVVWESLRIGIIGMPRDNHTSYLMRSASALQSSVMVVSKLP